MHFSLIIPALQAGAKARRKSWEGKQYIYVDGPYSDGKSIRRCSGAAYGTWPSDPRDSGDLLADDWEVLPNNVREYHSYLRSDVAAAVDVVTAHMKEQPPRDERAWKKSVKDVVDTAVESLTHVYASSSDSATTFGLLRALAASSVGALADFISLHEDIRESLREPRG